MNNKEYSEKQFNEVKKVIDEVIDIFRKHEMTVEEIDNMLTRIRERTFNISILPNKENEPEYMKSFDKRNLIHYKNIMY